MTKLNKNECAILINVINNVSFKFPEFKIVEDLVNKLVTIGNEEELVEVVADVPNA